LKGLGPVEIKVADRALPSVGGEILGYSPDKLGLDGEIPALNREMLSFEREMLHSNRGMLASQMNTHGPIAAKGCRERVAFVGNPIHGLCRHRPFAELGEGTGGQRALFVDRSEMVCSPPVMRLANSDRP
jgi:hypothetical protein